MQCTHCNAIVPDHMNFCQSCGAPVTMDSTQQTQYYQSQPYQQPTPAYQNQQAYSYQNQQAFEYQNQAPYGQAQPYQNPPYGQMTGRTKADFKRHPNVRKYNGNLIGACCILYFCAGITLLVNTLLAGNIFSFVDFSIILGLTLGIHLAKSRVCAIILTCYAGINMLYMLITFGTPGGWLIVVGAIYALAITCTYQSSWKRFQQTGFVY